MDFWLSICRRGRIREISRNMAVIVGNVRVCAMAKECRDYRRVTHARVFDSFEVGIVSCVASADDNDILGAECLNLRKRWVSGCSGLNANRWPTVTQAAA